MTAKTFTMTIDLAATPDEVWRALTEAGELVRWFAPEAVVTPGAGGRMLWRWADLFSWETAIETWEPGERLVLAEHRGATDIHGTPLPGTPQRVAMEFTLEAQAGGTTRLRLVHSGFGSGEGWDDEFEGISAGWQFELRGLAFYFARHKGRNRVQAGGQRIVSAPLDAVWTRLFQGDAFSIAAGGTGDGQRLVLASPTGTRIEGRVLWHNPQHDLVLCVDALDDGLFRISAWHAGGKTGVQVWMTTYAPDRADAVRAFGDALQPALARLLPG